MEITPPAETEPEESQNESSPLSWGETSLIVIESSPTSGTVGWVENRAVADQLEGVDELTWVLLEDWQTRQQLVLSPDLVHHVFSFLNEKDLLTLRLVCHSWRAVVDYSIHTYLRIYHTVVCKEQTENNTYQQQKQERTIFPWTDMMLNAYGSVDILRRFAIGATTLALPIGFVIPGGVGVLAFVRLMAALPIHLLLPALVASQCPLYLAKEYAIRSRLYTLLRARQMLRRRKIARVTQNPYIFRPQDAPSQEQSTLDTIPSTQVQREPRFDEVLDVGDDNDLLLAEIVGIEPRETSWTSNRASVVYVIAITRILHDTTDANVAAKSGNLSSVLLIRKSYSDFLRLHEHLCAKYSQLKTQARFFPSKNWVVGWSWWSSDSAKDLVKERIDSFARYLRLIAHEEPYCSDELVKQFLSTSMQLHDDE